MGAGRTEVARAIVGADRRHRARSSSDGRAVTLRNPAEAARHGIGYLSEDRKQFGLLLEQDVNANIALPLAARAFSRVGFVRTARRPARTPATTSSGCRSRPRRIDQTTKNLSGGNQQKVVIAKWLVKDCDILIFDEPTRGIDVGAKEEIYALLNDLAAAGQVDHHDLVGAARGAADVAPDRGDGEGRVTGVLEAAEVTQETVMHLATLRPITGDDRHRRRPAVPLGPVPPRQGVTSP